MAESRSSAEDIERVLMAVAPRTIGDLKKAIENMDPDLVVFRFEYGNIHGCSSWKRKETWKQWLKKQKK